MIGESSLAFRWGVGFFDILHLVDMLAAEVVMLRLDLILSCIPMPQPMQSCDTAPIEPPRSESDFTV